MNQKELTKTFMMISNPFGLHGLYKNFQRCRGNHGNAEMNIQRWPRDVIQGYHVEIGRPGKPQDYMVICAF